MAFLKGVAFELSDSFWRGGRWHHGGSEIRDHMIVHPDLGGETREKLNFSTLNTRFPIGINVSDTQFFSGTSAARVLSLRVLFVLFFLFRIFRKNPEIAGKNPEKNPEFREIFRIIS